MEKENVKSYPEWLRKHPAVLVLVVLVCWLAFFVALLAGSGEDMIEPPEETTPVIEELDGGVALEDDAKASEAKTDPLEQVWPTFNISSLTMPFLKMILAREHDLELVYPESAESLSIMALEKGGRPLGNILAELLASEGYCIYSQGNVITMAPAQYPKAGSENLDIETSITFDHSEPVNLWLSTRPVLKIQVATRETQDDDDSGTIPFIVQTGFGARVFLNAALTTRLGEAAELDCRGLRRTRVALKPEALEGTRLTLQVGVRIENGS